MFEDLLMNHPLVLAVIVLVLLLLFQSYIAKDWLQRRHQFGIVMPWIIFVFIVMYGIKDGTISLGMVIPSFLGLGLCSLVSAWMYQRRKKVVERR